MAKPSPMWQAADDLPNRKPAFGRGPKKRPRAFRHALPVLLLLALSSAACQPPQEARLEVRLYDLGGASLLRCNLSPSPSNPYQGSMRSQAPNGEVFQGEWIKLNSGKIPEESSSDITQASLPPLPVEASAAASHLNWAAGLGIDFSHFPSTYFSFLLHGSAGTLIDGFFLANASAGGVLARSRIFNMGLPAGGLIGAARDNKGHLYKLMG